MGYAAAIALVLAVLLAAGAALAAIMGAGALGLGLAAGFSAVIGVQLASLTLVSAYVWRAGYDARRRPVFVAKSVLSVQPDTEAQVNGDVGP